MATHLPNVHRKPFKRSQVILQANDKPPLLSQMEQIVQNGSSNIVSENSYLKTSVLRSAVELFISASPMYGYFIRRLLEEYDRIIQNPKYDREDTKKIQVDSVDPGCHVDKEIYDTLTNEIYVLKQTVDTLKGRVKYDQEQFNLNLKALQANNEEERKNLSQVKHLLEEAKKQSKAPSASMNQEHYAKLENELYLQSQEIVKLRVEVDKYKGRNKELKRVNEQYTMQHAELMCKMQSYDEVNMKVVQQYEDKQRDMHAMKISTRNEIAEMKKQVEEAARALAHEKLMVEKLSTACKELKQRCIELQSEKEEILAFRNDIAHTQIPSHWFLAKKNQENYRTKLEERSKSIVPQRKPSDPPIIPVKPREEDEGKIIGSRFDMEDMGRRKRWFIGLGRDSSIPLHLRYSGKLRNREVRKRDLERIIRNMWNDKKTSEKQVDVSERMSLGQYLLQWLQVRYPNEKDVYSWSYSIMDACDCYNWDADVELFQKILKCELSESVYDDQNRQIKKFIECLRQQDLHLHNGACTGYLDIRHIHYVINKYFPTKPPENIAKLKLSLCDSEELTNNPTAKIFYTTLFESDSEGNQGTFAETFRDQHLEEIELYLSEIKDAMLDLTQESGMITLYHVKNAILRVDPDASPKEVNYKILSTIGSPNQKSDIEWNTEVEWLSFFQKMQSTLLLKRSTKWKPKSEVDTNVEPHQWNTDVATLPEVDIYSSMDALISDEENQNVDPE